MLKIFNTELISTSSLLDSMIRDKILRWERECFVSNGEIYTFRSNEDHLSLVCPL